MTIEITNFCKRQFDKPNSKNPLSLERAKTLIKKAASPYSIKQGYADFTRIVTLKNQNEDGSFIFPELKALVMNRTDAFAKGAKLETAYEARTEYELPVLIEWVSGIEAPTAPWIHLILYSQEQLAKENDPISTEWGLVAVSCGLHDEIDPMQPITAMRNALGVEEGGSGFPLDREAYRKSAQFWSEHIKIKL